MLIIVLLFIQVDNTSYVSASKRLKRKATFYPKQKSISKQQFVKKLIESQKSLHGYIFCSKQLNSDHLK